jgi:hypothetical protein
MKNMQLLQLIRKWNQLAASGVLSVSLDSQSAVAVGSNIPDVVWIIYYLPDEDWIISPVCSLEVAMACEWIFIYI